MKLTPQTFDARPASFMVQRPMGGRRSRSRGDSRAASARTRGLPLTGLGPGRAVAVAGTRVGRGPRRLRPVTGSGRLGLD